MNLLLAESVFIVKLKVVLWLCRSESEGARSKKWFHVFSRGVTLCIERFVLNRINGCNP